MSKSAIWVLVASDCEAAIWSSEAGSSRLLQLITHYADAGEDQRGAFAWRLMSELSRGAMNEACDGIIIMADDLMLRELRRVTVPEIKRLLVAEIFAAPSAIAAIPSAVPAQPVWETVQ
jgi:protein required for attachment to host cells